MKFLRTYLILFLSAHLASAQDTILAQRPPMGWMSWNLLSDHPKEKDIMDMADAMVKSGMVEAGYDYIFLDDCWQGGRDSKNNIIADAKKFPSGIKALADYLHDKKMKLGIYSDAAQLTCGHYTGSLNFEDQDARTFASWGIDYLKYDYCNAPADVDSARARYKKMADALRKSGRSILLGVCEWGPREPWKWAAEVGGQSWRTTFDIRDKWIDVEGKGGIGIYNVIDKNAELSNFSGPGKWNDGDMLVAGLHGKEGPSSAYNATGCTKEEYQSQMSLYCMLNSPLYASCDIREMDNETKTILTNQEVIALNQDPLGKQAQRRIKTDKLDVFIRPLENGDVAIAILNKMPSPQTVNLGFGALGMEGKYETRDLWAHRNLGKRSGWSGKILCHETKLMRLKRI
ncbi:glycoside hydrolase family 27 protein [Pedobacter sp. MC2016-05]|uniref:glycoside hydrolase family 27 protein n=1 Tax=Pedobacter sp. MC2016-05 TaxID=2994474 RepID=UPI002245CE06|nr:glycoside hydrolase family 27 protein [Pedobacter sp. MC2016-05]MCX2473769.1 glycoside hydrolase family 27 protein [Pedobacter sp. MC2016-05]